MLFLLCVRPGVVPPLPKCCMARSPRENMVGWGVEGESAQAWGELAPWLKVKALA